jgi:hypothetical protein
VREPMNQSVWFGISVTPFADAFPELVEQILAA